MQHIRGANNPVYVKPNDSIQKTNEPTRTTIMSTHGEQTSRHRSVHLEIKGYSKEQKEHAFTLLKRELPVRYLRVFVTTGYATPDARIPRTLHLLAYHKDTPYGKNSWARKLGFTDTLSKNVRVVLVRDRFDDTARALGSHTHLVFDKERGNPPHQGVSDTLYRLRQRAANIGMTNAWTASERALKEHLESFQDRIRIARARLEHEFNLAGETPNEGTTIGRSEDAPVEEHSIESMEEPWNPM